MKRRYLLTPGPSQVPSFVREALGREMMHHRTEEFREILKASGEGLKEIFCTKNPVLTLASSGTGAMEAAVTNLVNKGEKIIVLRGGKFSERWAEIAKAWGIETINMDVVWGTSPDPVELDKLLTANKGVKAVFTTLCETSTATVFDIKALAQVAKKHNVMIAVDAISGLGQDLLLTDEWGVDVVVSGSQKGLMLPPGLAFISLSEKAQAAAQSSNQPTFYFSLKKALKNYEKNDTAFTPAVSLIVGLKDAVNAIKEDGVAVRFVRFARMAHAVREAGKAIGLTVYSKRPSDSVTAFNVPEGMKAKEIVKKMRKEYGVSIAAGQGEELEEKIIRIAHMGWVNEQDLIMCFSLLEKVLKDMGYKVKVGASVARFQEVIYG